MKHTVTTEPITKHYLSNPRFLLTTDHGMCSNQTYTYICAYLHRMFNSESHKTNDLILLLVGGRNSGREILIHIAHHACFPWNLIVTATTTQVVVRFPRAQYQIVDGISHKSHQDCYFCIFYYYLIFGFILVFIFYFFMHYEQVACLSIYTPCIFTRE